MKEKIQKILEIEHQAQAKIDNAKEEGEKLLLETDKKIDAYYSKKSEEFIEFRLERERGLVEYEAGSRAEFEEKLSAFKNRNDLLLKKSFEGLVEKYKRIIISNKDKNYGA